MCLAGSDAMSDIALLAVGIGSFGAFVLLMQFLWKV
jgi:hypothetical protein